MEVGSDRVIAVTIGVGPAFRELAELAAETCRRRTGLETVVVGDEMVARHDPPSPHWLKCHLFDAFPEADRILYFDADSVFLADFDVRPLAAARTLACVRDLVRSAEEDSDAFGVPVGEYFNSGFLLMDRELHQPMLRRAQELFRTAPRRTGFREQSYLNQARIDLGLPASWLDGERFNVINLGDRPWSDRIVHGHFNGIGADGESSAARALMLDWVLRSHVADHRLPEPALGSGNALAHAEEFIARIRDPPEFVGRGITICAGGPKYFPCAWVCIRMLREVGCTLPIQVWHLGAGELDDTMRSLLAPHGVETVDALAVRRRHPVRRLAGWELKPYAMLHSPFREVLALDADNVVVRDPTDLFDCRPYHETGAVFWPDYGRLGPEREIWSVCGVEYCDEPEFESGQVLVDKRRCWRELQLTMHYNEQSEFYYRLIHGDKDTFHLAWRKLGTPYAMVPTPIESLGGRVMCQHDFEGRRLFQHRNLSKWNLDHPSRRISGFLHEDRCREFLDELRHAWGERRGALRRPAAPPQPAHAVNGSGGGSLPNHADPALVDRLVSGRWIYERVGRDRRPMAFGRDGTITEGAGRHEESWKLSHDGRGPVLIIRSALNVTCTLAPRDDGTWAGEWLRRDPGPVRLRRVPSH